MPRTTPRWRQSLRLRPIPLGAACSSPPRWLDSVASTPCPWARGWADAPYVDHLDDSPPSLLKIDEYAPPVWTRVSGEQYILRMLDRRTRSLRLLFCRWCDRDNASRWVKLRLLPGRQ